MTEHNIKSVHKLLDILESFRMDQPEKSLAEICSETQLNKTTIFRLLRTLVARGYIKQNQDNQKYSLGFKFFNLGSIVLNQMDLRSVAIESMKNLNQECGETIALFISDESNRICIETVDSNQVIRNIMQVGARYPLHKGAPGKIFFLQKNHEEIAAILSKYDFTSSDVENFIANLEIEKTTGYFVSAEENFEGAYAIASPIYDYKGELCASLSICGPTSRLTKEKKERLGKLVQATARQISLNLGSPRQETIFF